ncbi:unnamed protein product [Aphanomyces euteiches]|uniref:FYVE-type domain-containing protein n=1 Tax=Aphanomyces euteiches TaxID=100861 RepID=A0A6G0X5B6_9STRA|nr:hypothetical protein Ae201684_008352 [Aphanomyces euteiches]
MRVDIHYEEHMAHMEYILKNALADAANWISHGFKAGWSIDVDKHGWRVCSRVKAKEATEQKFVCMGKLYASVSALRDAFYADCDRDLHALAAVVHGDMLIDTSVLSVHARRTPEDPGRFFGVKSMKLSAKGSESSKRALHYVYLEYTGTYVDPQGRATFYIITEPIKQHAAEKVSVVKLYRERADGATVDAFVRAHVHTQAAGPVMTLWKEMNMHVPQSLTKDFFPLTKEGSVYESLVLATGPFAPLWDYGRKNCNVCDKKCNMWRRRHHCRCCGLIMCSGCTVKLHCVNRPSKKKKATKAVAQEKFCTRCWVEARTVARKPRCVTASSTPIESHESALPEDPSPEEDFVLLIDPPSKITTAEWWQSMRDLNPNCGPVWNGDEASVVSVMSSHHRRTSRLHNFNLITTPSSKEEIAAMMDEMNESIAVQSMLIHTMSSIMTPRSPLTCSSTLEEEIELL